MAQKPIKEPEAVEETVDVDALLPQLSKKNDEYIFKLRRILTQHQWTEERQRTVLAKMLPEIITAQHQGRPATQLYGPVTEKAESLIHAPKPIKKVAFWLSGVDLGFLFASMFGLVYGGMALVNHGKASAGNGLLSIIVMAMTAGFAFALYNDWSRAKKDARMKTWQILTLAVAIILAGSWVSGALAYLKTPLTTTMPWWAYLILAAASYGIHWLLKRKYHLRGLMA